MKQIFKNNNKQVKCEKVDGFFSCAVFSPKQQVLMKCGSSGLCDRPLSQSPKVDVSACSRSLEQFHQLQIGRRFCARNGETVHQMQSEANKTK